MPCASRTRAVGLKEEAAAAGLAVELEEEAAAAAPIAGLAVELEEEAAAPAPIAVELEEGAAAQRAVPGASSSTSSAANVPILITAGTCSFFNKTHCDMEWVKAAPKTGKHIPDMEPHVQNV